jgi:dihydrolipoamide dehydrogenase
MKEYELIVVGSGAGMNVVAKARDKGLKVALVENWVMGGTCLNRGCIPSKILTYPAEMIRQIKHAKEIGINAKIESVDFDLVRKRMWELVLRDRRGMEEGVAADTGLDFYHTTARFIAPYTLQVGPEQIKAPKIVLAIGVRTYIPDIPGLRETGFETSESIFDIQVLPKSLIILGGGYKACEFGHFFSAFGTNISIIGHNPRLLPREEEEVSDLVLAKMTEFANVKLNQEVISIRKGEKGKVVVIRDRTTGDVKELEADEILLTTGVQSNSDSIEPEASGIRTDAARYIAVDDHLETNMPGIFAIGDVIGRTMFRHTANYHAQLVWINAFAKNKVKLDEHAVPHAVFGYPEVASVGLTQSAAKAQGIKVLVGLSQYIDCAKGYAMGEQDSFAKVVVDMASYRIIGASAVGTNASIMVQAMVYLMNAGDQTYIPIARSQTIHPALSEVFVNAFGNLHDPDHVHVHEHEQQ